MNKEKIFILDSNEGFNLAEKFKRDLENLNFIVTTKPYGLSGVRVTGTKVD